MLLALLLSAQASDRHFTYTHETDVLGKGDVELEPWTTVRMGKEGWFLGMDQRLELEMGLGNRLQTSWYLNFAASRAEGPSGVFSTESGFEGVSWELKGKLSDPVADALGSALYLELSCGPEEAELEGKLLLDKSAGKFLFAFNLVTEGELAFEDAGVHPELKIELDLGVAAQLSQHVSLGVEVREHTVIEAEDEEQMELAHAGLFVGPTLAFRSKGLWGALSVLPQLSSLGPVRPMDLEEYERVSVRVLMGTHL